MIKQIKHSIYLPTLRLAISLRLFVLPVGEIIRIYRIKLPPVKIGIHLVLR